MSAYSDQVIADGATGLWLLEEPSGTSAASQVGSHTGTITGGVTLNQPGPSDGTKAMTFDGTTGYITMGDDAAFEFVAAFTVELWAKYTGVSNRLVSKILSSLAGWFLGTSAGNAIQFFAGTAGGSTVFNLLSTLAYNNNVWHHIVALWDGSSGADHAKLYVDGTLVATSTVNAVAIGTNNANFMIAAGALTPANFTAGTLARVAVYPLALSAAQVANHFALGVGGSSGGGAGGAATEYRARYRWRDAA